MPFKVVQKQHRFAVIICDAWLPDFFVPNMLGSVVHPYFFLHTDVHATWHNIVYILLNASARGHRNIKNKGSLRPSIAIDTQSVRRCEVVPPMRIEIVFSLFTWTVRFALQLKLDAGFIHIAEVFFIAHLIESM